jgi:hypothetical protein
MPSEFLPNGGKAMDVQMRQTRDPSPGPRRLVKAPDAGHPLPLGEG